MIELSKEWLLVELCCPGEYYQGTRFDRAGVFRRIVKDDYVFADEWFSHSDPFKHDHVCGLSEEFVTVDLDGIEPGGVFCKPGVGLLKRPDDKPYDWFRMYEIADPGKWKVTSGDSEVLYEHELNGWYRYSKRISILDASHLKIDHELCWQNSKPLKGFFYNHNFLTFGGFPVSPSRRIEFPWPPSGDWRSKYDNVRFNGNVIEILGPVDHVNTVYCGNLHNAAGPTGCEFVISDGGHSVAVKGDKPLHHYVFWANDRVACPEPYMPISLAEGDIMRWSFNYCFR